MSMSTLGSGIGTFAMAPLIVTLLDRYMFRGCMLVMGAMQLNNLVAGALFRPRNHKTITHREVHKSGLWQTFRSQTAILTDTTFLLYGLQILAMSICIQTFLTFLPSLAEQYGISKSMAAVLVSVVGLSDMAGRFLFGIVFDLSGVRHRRRLFHAYLGVPVGFLCMLMGYLSTYSLFVTVSVLFGIVEGGFHSQRVTLVSEFVSPEKMSSTVGLVIFFQSLGNLAGPPVAGESTNGHLKLSEKI